MNRNYVLIIYKINDKRQKMIDNFVSLISALKINSKKMFLSRESQLSIVFKLRTMLQRSIYD